jgi:hypothetical protein
MPAKDFGSASTIDHINSPKDLCETKPILPGSPAHATAAKKFANHARPVPAQKFASQATLQPPQHPTDQEKLLELEKLYETSRHALERHRFALKRYNEAFAKFKKTPWDLAHEQLQELYEELYENMTPDEQEFFEENSSLITSQELCRQCELQVLYEELYEDTESEEQHFSKTAAKIPPRKNCTGKWSFKSFMNRFTIKSDPKTLPLRKIWTRAAPRALRRNLLRKHDTRRAAFLSRFQQPNHFAGIMSANGTPRALRRSMFLRRHRTR